MFFGLSLFTGTVEQNVPGLGFSFSPVQCARLPKVRADWLSSDSNPLELHVSTNNDAVIASIVVFDPDGGLFGGEVI